MRFFITIFIFLSTLSTGIGQTIVSGTISDALSKEKIPYVNLVIPTTQQGTISNLDGSYQISIANENDSILISCLGYEPQKHIASHLSTHPNIFLIPTSYNISTITVAPTKSPVFKILERVIKNASKNDPEKQGPFSCLVYHKATFDFVFPDSLSKTQNKYYKQAKHISTDNHILLVESLTEKNQLSENKKKEKIITGRVSGFKDPSLATFPAQIQPFSFYQKQIILLNHSFINPLCKQGLRKYKFRLKDTIYTSNQDTLFYISFAPRHSKDINALSGSCHISSNGYAVKTVRAKTPSTFKKFTLSIRQTYTLLNNNRWFPLELESKFQFSQNSQSKKLPFPVIASSKSYITNPDFSPNFSSDIFYSDEFDGATNEEINNSQLLNKHRYRPLTKKDSLTYQIIDSIGKANHLDQTMKTLKNISNREIPMGKINFDLAKLLDYNRQEGLRLGAGLGTNKKLSEYIKIKGYLTYGTKDKDFKYGGEFEIKPFKQRFLSATMGYINDLIPTGDISFLEQNPKKSAENFKKFMNKNMDPAQQASFSFQLHPVKYVKLKIAIKTADITQRKLYPFQLQFPNQFVMPITKTNSEIKLAVRWKQGEKSSKNNFGTSTCSPNTPTLWANIIRGKGTSTEKTSFYTKSEVQIEQTIQQRNGNTLTTRINAGLIHGNPDPSNLYSNIGTYSPIGLDIPFTFSTMRANEFAAKEFSQSFLRYQIPLFKKHPKFNPSIELNSAFAISSKNKKWRTFHKGFYESGISISNLYSNLLFRYGIGISYRYGSYSLNKEPENWAFKLGIAMKL